MDIIKYLSGMLNFDSKMDWIDEQKFTADGKPIPISDEKIATEAVPKMMTPAMTDEQVHAAAEAGEAWKKELQRWLKASSELAAEGMLNSKKDIGGRNKAVKKLTSLKTSEKPGWKLPTDAEGNINGNYWSVNENDPYWQTTEGYKEAIELYGFKPGWVKEPVKKSNIVNFQPTKRISL
mgnify:CR=1 FL=1